MGEDRLDTVGSERHALYPAAINLQIQPDCHNGGKSLAVMAEHVAAARIAAQSVFAGGHGLSHVAACAIAQARASEAAQLVAGVAHAVHGAFGVTHAFDLQMHTRRLHE